MDAAAGEVSVITDPSGFEIDVVGDPLLLVTVLVVAPASACSSGSLLAPLLAAVYGVYALLRWFRG